MRCRRAARTRIDVVVDNYGYCVDLVRRRFPRNARVLDYGCGAGQIVGLLRANGFDGFGCDVFYDGGSYESAVPEDLRDRYVVRMTEHAIPFADASFDVVISNQVFEHVADIDRALSEIRRVLRPGGYFLCLFPDRRVWREGHCGIAFLHWFPKNSRPRIYWAALWRVCGFGYFKRDVSIMQWSRDWCDWLDRWTHYRGIAEIRRSFSKYFDAPENLEADWLHARYAHRRRVFSWWPHQLKRLVVIKLAHRVFLFRAATTDAPTAPA